MARITVLYQGRVFYHESDCERWTVGYLDGWFATAGASVTVTYV